jgi:hypothetical protein
MTRASRAVLSIACAPGVTASLALGVVWRPLDLSGSQRSEARFPQLVLAASCGVVVCFLSYAGLMVQAMYAGLVD